MLLYRVTHLLFFIGKKKIIGKSLLHAKIHEGVKKDTMEIKKLCTYKHWEGFALPYNTPGFHFQ